ncbi:acyl-CoA dehydrogenase family protein [Lapillicoccus sp.]|uniref:acyl-CoA dehydrogenase family protein n=1 Tax=Lapillicoccus sp. TaxID=1909287 RepID=UPI0025F70B9D|nr:acyl-CoA dehydrogenase family protein [Lapillicoccus sp.]
MTDESTIPSDLHRRVTWLIASGAADLPLPGAGRTAARWAALTARTRDDVVVGRLVEAHADADAILAQLAGRRVAEDEWWGVWAAEPPTPQLRATRAGDAWTLTGGKVWCSGAGLCSHALVTARVGQHDSGLFAVDLGHEGASADTTVWKGTGMARSRTGTVTFDRVPAERIGSRSDYLDRAGFWHGAIGVAACWLGGAERVADTLRSAAAARPLDPHALAHLGAVDAALAGARWTMDGAAAETDRQPDDRGAAHLRALRVRAVVEAAAALTIDRVGRALGPAPLCQDEIHAGTVDDLLVYLRQSHAERDLASLGGVLAAGGHDG